MKKGTFFTSFGAIIILIISFIAFVLPSSFGASTNTNTETFGSFNGREITEDNILASYYNNYNINAAIENTLVQFAFEDMATNSGYISPTRTINKEIRSYYVDDNGNFSKNKLRLAKNEEITNITKTIQSNLKYYTVKNDITPKYFSEKDRSENIFGKKVSENELKFYNDLSKDVRGFNLISFDKQDFPKEAIIAWANENSSKFDSFDFSIATFDDEKTATKYADKLNNNEITFDELMVNDENRKIYTGADNKCTITHRYEIQNILVNKDDISIFDSLESGKISAPFAINDKFAIARMNAPVSKVDLSNSNAIEEIKTYIFSYEQTYIEDYFINIAKEFKQYALKTSFDKACTQFNVSKTEVAPFALNYGSSPLFSFIDTSIPSLSQASFNENLLKTAFSLQKDEISEPIVTENQSTNGYIVVLQYVDVKPEETYNVNTELQYSVIQQNNSRSIILSVMNDPKTKIKNNYF